MDVAFADLVGALRTPKHRPGRSSRLRIAPEPQPFVPPPLRVANGGNAPFAVELLFVRAAAAVGKSTMANYLSAQRGIPLLDLASVPVSTGSLRALIADLEGERDPLQAFLAGELPIIVDALDEGRLLSGETGFESFVETTGELLAMSRRSTDQPKLIIFGRPESAELAQLLVELQAGGATSRFVDVGFFGEEEARRLIDVYALAAAKPDSPYRRHGDAVGRLVDTYFEAIEGALGLPKGELWSNESGRAFAGYAPVLAALGELLAQIDNFVDVTNRLRQSGAHEAWAVIESVLDEILRRERGKLTGRLREHISVEVPDAAYDRREQLTLLMKSVHHQPLEGTGNVGLVGSDQARYDEMIRQYLPEHPFLRQGQLANAVLASVVLAHGVVEDLFPADDLKLVDVSARQPFLWRSLRHAITSGSLIDGRYVGVVLDSLWSDPIREPGRVAIRGAGDESANVLLTYARERVDFDVTLPLVLHGQLRDCSIDVDGSVRAMGFASMSGQPVFDFLGSNSITCSEFEVTADVATVDGSLWLEAGQVRSKAGMRLLLKNGSVVGWGGQVGNTHPWNKHKATLRDPEPESSDDTFTAFIEECSQRLTGSASVLTLKPDLSVPDDDGRMAWAVRKYGNGFSELITLMVRHGLATTEKMAASGAAKVRVHFQISWRHLNDVIAGRVADESLDGFIREARDKIGRK